jgi:hypothetical protein
MMVAIMLCRLYGKKDTSKFKSGWVPLIHCVLKEKVFNWAYILSANIKQEVQKSQEAPPRYCPGFFMFGYLTNVVYAITPFSLLAWNDLPLKKQFSFTILKYGQSIVKKYSMTSTIISWFPCTSF